MSILSDISIANRCNHNAVANYIAAIRETEKRHLSLGIGAYKSEEEVQRLAEEELARRPPAMITPFKPESIKEVGRADGGRMRIISAGLTSFGYDVSLAREVKIFSNIHSAEIDPKRFDQDKCLIEPIIRKDTDGAEYVTLPANSYLLGPTEEYFHIPRDIMVICVGKSTYARSGVVINTTPIEPGFEGQVVIEVFNGTTSPVRIYLNEGIAQFLFLKGDQACKVSYKDRAGKYMGQTGITMSKV